MVFHGQPAGFIPLGPVCLGVHSAEGDPQLPQRFQGEGGEPLPQPEHGETVTVEEMHCNLSDVSVPCCYLVGGDLLDGPVSDAGSEGLRDAGDIVPPVVVGVHPSLEFPGGAGCAGAHVTDVPQLPVQAGGVGSLLPFREGVHSGQLLHRELNDRQLR